MRRAKTFDVNLSKDSVKREHFLSFMQKLFDNGHAELAPPVKIGEEVWYFLISHPNVFRPQEQFCEVHKLQPLEMVDFRIHGLSFYIPQVPF
jgi:hypothetical protein